MYLELEEKMTKFWKNRDADSFSEFYKYYKPFIYNVIRSRYMRTADPIDIDDVVMRGFVNIWNGIETYDPTYTFSNWVYTIFVNQAKAWFNKRNRNNRLFDYVLEKYGDPIEDDENIDELYDILIKGFELMEEGEEKQCLDMKFFKDMSLKEISEETGYNIQYIKNKIFRGKRILRKICDNLLSLQ